MIMKKFKIIMIVVILLIAVIVAFQNKQPVETKFLFASVTMPRMLLILVTFALGFLGGMIAASLILRKSDKPKKITPTTNQTTD